MELYYSCMPRLILLVFLALSPASMADDRVPAALLRLPEATPTVFIAETASSVYHRFDRSGDTVTHVSRDYMSIGLGGAGKKRTGDQRTPLGIYFVTEQLDTERLHEKYGVTAFPLKYGVTAFPLDYPNAWDQRRGRTGSGIWVHGVEKNGGQRPPLDTDGCLALPNDRLLALEHLFLPNVTPVLIAREIAWSDAATVARTRAALEKAVRQWAQALEQGDMATWLDTYDPAFEHLGLDKAEWTAFSLQTFGQRPIRAVDVSELLLLQDPVEDDLFLSRFRLDVAEEDGRRVVSVRRLYWRRTAQGAFRIVAQDAG
ncbi:MAG: L,D-transpeptidase family protein [Woeseiaceae bacterium]